jgi:hypothetical protein
MIRARTPRDEGPVDGRRADRSDTPLASALVAENLAVLRQAVDLVDALDPELYRRDGRFERRSGIGAHVRHCVEFYDAFLEGARTGRIDYGTRTRDLRLSSDPGFARERLRAIAATLAGFDGVAEGASVLVRAEGDAARDVWSASSLGRELHALASHVVHHFALVALLLRLEGVEPAEDLGVAPSTLEYWRDAECAR